jgi:serine/threonine protein kinase
MECLRDNFYDVFVLDGRFQTVSPLNHGSFGMVFLAKDLKTNENVAIKCLTKQSAAKDAQTTFAIDEKSEEMACHTLLGSHPNIVNMIHSFETENHVYLVLEFCSRGDLYEAIRTGCGPLETEHVRQFMLQLIDAVEFIHSKGLYHRDIKPENIFIAGDGSMKLGDFGLATRDAWSYETAVGSDRYMAPEQYDSAGAGYSPAQADIWAVGVILLNVLFSRNPFNMPTEDDPLFLDYCKDKQSLFDVFTDMSQDTFDVIMTCMSLDPKKRSLQAAREALKRVVTFTMSDEFEDDFHAIVRKPVASANREPLRTPTVKTPQIENGTAFPWAKALQASTPQARQLSMIPDTESYTEDLFPKSEESRGDWFSVCDNTPSLASVMDSSLGASMHSLAYNRPALKRFQELSPISGSLPINMAKSMMASLFKKDTVSKSWSDLYDEDIEEEEERLARVLKERQAQNARTFSHEEVKTEQKSGVIVEEEQREEEITPLCEKTASAMNIRSREGLENVEPTEDIDGEDVSDLFLFQAPSTPINIAKPRYTPPSKRIASSVDKWEALGARRRAITGQSLDNSPEIWRGKRSLGNTHNTTQHSAFGKLGVWEHKPAATGSEHRNGMDGTWIRGKDHAHNNNTPIRVRTTIYHNRTPVKEQENVDHAAPEIFKKDNLGDLEWVGGWNDSVAGLQL